MSANRNRHQLQGLARHLAWLYPDPDKPCTCEHAHKSGRLYGIDMGKGWVRTMTNETCPHHGGGRR